MPSDSVDDSELTKDSNQWIIALDNGSKEANILCHAKRPAHNINETRHILLYEGGIEKSTDKIVDTVGNPAGNISVMVVDDINLWISMYLTALELHYVSENQAHKELKNIIPEKYNSYEKWLSNLSISDRKLRLLNQAEKDSEWDSLYDDILKTGSWRNKSKDKDLMSFAKALNDKIDFTSDGCYKNARLVLEKDRYWNNSNVQYVEGIALRKQAGRISGHAWIEHNERVVELTWPWHTPIPSDKTIYFGSVVSRKELKESWRKNEYGPYILNLKDSKIA